MVMARLHIICGNCGCNDGFMFIINPEGHDISDTKTKFEPSVSIMCHNCSTIHDLSDNATMVQNEAKKQ